MDVNSIYKGDSFQILPNVSGKSVDLVLTDPPYDFNFLSKQFIHKHLTRISKGCVIVFSPPENQWVLPADQYLFWIKPISTKNTSKSYSRFVEMIFVYGRGAWNNNRHWSQYTNVFQDLVDDNRDHMFRKPLSLLERLILNHTNEGDLVLDPFCGSGSVLQVCKKLNRNYIGIELNDVYYDVAKDNLNG